MLTEALAELQQDADRNHHKPFPYIAYLYARLGNRAAAEKMIHDYQQEGDQSVLLFRYSALVYAALNDKDRAFEWLEKGFKVKDIFLLFLKVEPEWDGLRDDPRFADLLKRIGF